MRTAWWNIFHVLPFLSFFIPAYLTVSMVEFYNFAQPIILTLLLRYFFPSAFLLFVSHQPKMFWMEKRSLTRCGLNDVKYFILRFFTLKCRKMKNQDNMGRKNWFFLYLCRNSGFCYSFEEFHVCKHQMLAEKRLATTALNYQTLQTTSLYPQKFKKSFIFTCVNTKLSIQ
jgi:hypothetical protein